MDIATTPIRDLQACGRLVQFMESTRFNETSPRDDLARNDTDYVLAAPGEVYIAYANSGSNLGISMLTGSYRATWYDPVDGDRVDDGFHDLSTGDHTFSKPTTIGDESVLYFESASASPNPVCLSDVFAYPNGNLNGNGGWNGSATSQIQVLNQTVQISGDANTYDTIHNLNCQNTGGEVTRIIAKVKRGFGNEIMWNLWIDDSSGNNLARWYGSGTTVRGGIGATAQATPLQTLTGLWDTLMVKIDPSANTSEFIFNGTSIGTLDHSPTGAGDILARIKFETIGNSNAVGHNIFFDNLIVGELNYSPDFDSDGDVDQNDFGHLQGCYSGDGTTYQTGCQDADLDTDGDVDGFDYSLLDACKSGPNLPTGC